MNIFQSFTLKKFNYSCKDNIVNFSKFLKYRDNDGWYRLKLTSDQTLLLKDLAVKHEDNTYPNYLVYTNTSKLTIILATYALWSIIYKNNIQVCYFAKTLTEGAEFLYTVKMLYESLPEIVKPKINSSNEYCFKLDNLSHIRLATTADSVRGQHMNIVIFDYFDRYSEKQKADAVYSIAPTVYSASQTSHQLIFSAQSASVKWVTDMYTMCGNKKNNDILCNLAAEFEILAMQEKSTDE